MVFGTNEELSDFIRRSEERLVVVRRRVVLATAGMLSGEREDADAELDGLARRLRYAKEERARRVMACEWEV